MGMRDAALAAPAAGDKPHPGTHPRRRSGTRADAEARTRET